MLGEKELHTLLIQNPEKGLGLLMDRYMAFVYTIVYGKLSKVCSKQDIEECVSGIFYEVYRTRTFIDLEKGSLKTYLAVLSKRSAIDAYRRLRSRAGDVSLDEFEHDWIASDKDVEGSVIESEANDRLIHEILALGEPDSQIVIRRYYFGQSSKVISRILGIRENTINKKVSRALGKLKLSLGGAL